MNLKRIFLTLFILLLAQAASGENRYVSDVLYVSLRSAADDSSESVAVLKSGTKLTVLEEVEQDGYIHVQTEDNKEGWIKSRYLLNDPIAAIRVSALEKELNTLRSDNQSLKQEMAGMKKESKETSKERKRVLTNVEKLQAENQRLKQLAKEPMKLSDENAKLKQENNKIQQELQVLQNENASFKENNVRNWFMVGAGVLFIGIIMGLILPSMRFRRSSGWS